MIRPEIEIAFKHLRMVASHPQWLGAYLRSGRRGLIRQMMEESLSALAGEEAPSEVSELSVRRGVTVFTELGATQEYLYHAVRALRPRAVVETGVYRGISTAFILAALDANGTGQLYSIDLPSAEYSIPGTKITDSSPLKRSEETGFAIPSRLRGRWTLLVGDVRSHLPALLERLGTIDMFYHDSEHTAEIMSWEFNLAWKHLRQGGLLTTDDYTWNDAFDRFVASHPISFVIKRGNRLGIAQKAG